jgi:site-specific DNA-methyltransferase (adenine-specific)
MRDKHNPKLGEGNCFRLKIAIKRSKSKTIAKYNNNMINISNEDNMELMKRYPDNYFDLAIVDPPYGIGLDKGCNTGKVGKYGSKHKPKEWDNCTPNREYFDELFRVSKNQIIWGGNYFTDYLSVSKSWIIWDKVQPASNFASCELAWTSTNTRMSIFKYGFNLDRNKIHPTQKPISLYEWMIKHYTEPNFKIIDTHIGSGSIAIAVDNANKIDKMNLTLVGCELDKDYYNATMKRIKEQTSWQSLF